jgi:hypothetical protein
MAQGIARDKEKTIEALKPFFLIGCSVKKACEYGGVPQSTVQTWIDNDEALRVQVTAWQNEPNRLARSNWIAKMAEGDYASSKDWLSKREKDEFSDRVEQTGANGAPLTVTFDGSFNDSIYPSA